MRFLGAILVVISYVAGQQPQGYVSDTLTARAILDVNGLDTVPVARVAKTEGGRIVALDLSCLSLASYREVRIIPESIGDLSELRSLRLTGTQIVSLPVSICGLRKLEVLRLDGTGLTGLPDSIVNLTAVRDLSLWSCTVDGLWLMDLAPATKAWALACDTYSLKPILLFSPNGREIYRVGDSIHLRWGADSASVEYGVGIMLSLNKGKTYVSLSTELIGPNDSAWGDFVWVVPDSIGEIAGEKSPTASSDCIVKVEPFSPCGWDQSDTFFTILSSATDVRYGHREKPRTRIVPSSPLSQPVFSLNGRMIRIAAIGSRDLAYRSPIAVSYHRTSGWRVHR